MQVCKVKHLDSIEGDLSGSSLQRFLEGKQGYLARNSGNSQNLINFQIH